MNYRRGYTLVELIVAIGLFALVMMLASGAYFLMISINRQAQGIATGVDNLSFALESMTRSIRTGTDYACPTGATTCIIDASNNAFSFKNSNGVSISYSLSGSSIQRTANGVTSILTDPSVTVTSLRFYAFNTNKPPTDYLQSRVTMIVSGTVSYGSGRVQPFTVETGATMRGSDL